MFTVENQRGKPVSTLEVRIGQKLEWGGCAANERSVLVMEQDPKYWRYFGLMLINGKILRFHLDGFPRLLTGEPIEGSNGVQIQPGMIFVDSDESWNDLNLKSIHHEGTHLGNRTAFRTLELSPGDLVRLNLSPVRKLGEGQYSYVRLVGDNRTYKVDITTLQSLIAKVNEESRKY